MRSAELDPGRSEEARDLIKTVYAPPAARKAWRLEDLIGTELRYYSFGRIALAEALRACGVGTGDAVLLPELICRDALFAVNSLGARSLFYPVDESLAPAMAPEILPKAKAVVVVDYFGFPQDIRPFRKYASRSGAWIIEDNAHGLFSRDEQGRWLGLRADMGIFSIRKTIALPNGAALASTNGPALPDPVAFERAPQTWKALKAALRKSVSPLGVIPLRAVVGSRRSFKKMMRRQEFPNSGQEAEESFDQTPRPCEELASPLTGADPELEVWRRRILYGFCDSLARASCAVPVFNSLPEGVSPYVFPFYAEGKDLQRARKAFSREGLDTYPWPDLPGAVEPTAAKHYKNLWCVRFLW